MIHSCTTLATTLDLLLVCLRLLVGRRAGAAVRLPGLFLEQLALQPNQPVYLWDKAMRTNTIRPFSEYRLALDHWRKNCLSFLATPLNTSPYVR